MSNFDTIIVGGRAIRTVARHLVAAGQEFANQWRAGDEAEFLVRR
jgi:hypothetical protein